MTSTSLDISRMLEADLLEVIEQLISVCAVGNVEFFLVGAAARDIHFLCVDETTPEKGTADADFAFLVPSWDAFEKITAELTRDGKNSRDKKLPYRLRSAAGIIFDLIPFGEIEEPKGKISWPPDSNHVVSTIGLRDAFDSAKACHVRGAASLEFRTASIAGLAVLNLIAWADQYPNGSKDAIDFRFLIENYDAGQIDRLFSKEENLFDEGDSEYELAVARLLGRDVGRILSAVTKQHVLALLEGEQAVDGQLRLVSDMLDDSVQNADFVLAQLGHFQQGILDTTTDSTDTAE